LDEPFARIAPQKKHRRSDCARRLVAFYKSLLDDSAKDAHELFGRAIQQK
jgi:hypothetical protein